MEPTPQLGSVTPVSAAPRKTSALAITAFVLACLFFLPLLPKSFPVMRTDLDCDGRFSSYKTLLSSSGSEVEVGGPIITDEI